MGDQIGSQKMLDAPEIIIQSVAELIELLDRFGETPDMLFRGQSAQYGNLTTSIQRHVFEPGDVDRFAGVASHMFRDGVSEGYNFLEHLPRAEKYLIRQFQSRAKHHLDTVPKRDETSAWLALMQHYGAPTRLMDVTKSIFVAAYFATDHSQRHDGIIYVFFTPRYLLEMEGYPAENRLGGTGLIAQDQSLMDRWSDLEDHNDYPSSISKLADWSIGVSKLRGILQLESKFPTRREIAQRGCFLMPLGIDRPFEAHLNDTYELLKTSPKTVPKGLADFDLEDLPNHWPVLKLRIPRHRFRVFKISLQHMAITAETLYPDFEGLSKSMHGELRWHMEVNGSTF